jgi:hypothetical protein
MMLFSLLIFALEANSQDRPSVVIERGYDEQGTQTPSTVCNKKEYPYVVKCYLPTGNTNTYKLEISNTLGSVSYSKDLTADEVITIKNTWNASTTSNNGSLTAKLTLGSTEKTNTLSAEIKSIKHIKAQIPTLGSYYTLDPCSSGTMYLSAADIQVPGTGNPPEEVFNWKWLVPAGWTVDGQTSDGSTMIAGNQDVSVTYPASATEGSIKVLGYHVVSGCSDYQESLSSEPVTISRKKTFTLTPNKKYLLCGDTSPVTFTVSPALSCATYYWNGSQTASTSNTCQITPNGSTAVTVSVNIFYGGTLEAKTKTVNYYMFSKSNPPYIQGPPEVCPGGSSFSVSNLRSGQTVIYTPSTNISKTQTGNTCTLYSSSTGAGYLDATIHTNCGDTVISRKPLDVGSPQPGNIYIEMDAPPRRFTATIQNEVASATSYDWYLDGVLNTTYHGFSAIFNRKSPYCGREYHLEVRANNGCGSSAKTHKLVFEPDCLYRLVLSPNPTVDESTVELFDESTTTLASEMDWELEVYDQNQMLKEKKTRIKGNLTKI